MQKWKIEFQLGLTDRCVGRAPDHLPMRLSLHVDARDQNDAIALGTQAVGEDILNTVVYQVASVVSCEAVESDSSAPADTAG